MSSHFDGFIPIHCVFYSIFHPTEGTKVRHQFPPGCLENSGINFDTIKNYVIPKPQLCNKLLTFKYGPYRLVCYPVNVNASFYARNSFNFNFVFVFPYDCATSPYEPAIARLGKMFRVLEEQSQVLSKAEENPVYFHLKSMEPSQKSDHDSLGDGESSTANMDDQDHNQPKNETHAFEKFHEIMRDLKNSNRRLCIEDLITKIYQDLNNYSECLIPIDSGNSVDIKLFPLLSPPNSCLSFEDVPIATVNLAKLIDVNWDPTMLKIVPFINGINSISKIATFSDSDVNLVIECVKHLIYYNCVVLADIFQFSNIYAPTSLLGRFLTDPSLATACQLYVTFEEFSDFLNLPLDKKKSYQSRPISRKQLSNNTIETLRRKMSLSRDNSFGSGVDSSAAKQLSSSSQSSLTPGKNISETSLTTHNSEQGKQMPLTTKASLFDLYRSLSQGQSVKEWLKINFDKIREAHIDIRRFITFGVIHGLIYRCYSYPVMKNIGTLDMVRMLNKANDSDLKRWKLTDKHKTNNVLSTADIRVGLEHKLKGDSKYLQTYSNNIDIAEEVLKDVYKKLAISDSTDEVGVQSSNPISKIYGNSNETEQSSISIPRKGSSSSMGSDGRNRVSFELKKSQRPLNDDKVKSDTIDAMKEKRREEFLVLQSLKSVETLDKLCMRLEKDRGDIEVLLKDMGHYSIINS
ncbi:LAFE_0E00606g1_1 [Lachancea fermentati]|uniref:LAFE_0E00606g1_1 n=1 Tax=Lachancea fermentati TaxID=4955 RepID=A0A1G4MCB8_LACFM|nr:LAFE_0E00606g1_1 [Lachancea fermentati]